MFLLVFGLAGFMFLGLIGGFLKNIILFDSCFIGFAIWGVFSQKGLHPAFCLLLALGAVVAAHGIQRTKIGLLIVGGCMSFFWAYFVMGLVGHCTNDDRIWKGVSFGVSFLLIVGLHLVAREKEEMKGTI